MLEHHELMGGKLHVYRRENSGKWQCSTFLKGKNWRVSTKTGSLALAKEFAEDWYLTLQGKSRAGELKGGRTFAQAAKQYEHEIEIITEGERCASYVSLNKLRVRVHLLPFFGDRQLTDITAGTVQDYRIHRATSRRHPKTGEVLRPSRSTIHKEIVTLRQILKTANRHGWLQGIPNLSPPYKASGKIKHRAWFSPEEYKRFYTATRELAENPRHERWRNEYKNFHDYVLFMVNTGLRPDEGKQLQFRDVAIVTDEATGERILEIEVRGKRGVGYCKSMPGAVKPFERLLERRTNPQPTDLVFGKIQRALLNVILTDLNLKRDRDGNLRTAYSLRHTYICMRLMAGADIYQIAKNCRTSVEMIEKYYASHIKNQLDTAAINVRKPKSSLRHKKAA